MENQNIDVENLSLATTRTRTKAFIIDDLSITFIVMLLLWDPIMATNGDLMAIMIIMNQAFLQILVLKFLYQTFFVWYYGATLGKLIAKIKVIDFDHFGKVSLRNSALRSLGRILSESLFYLGFIFAFYTQSRQTFHDKLGKTLVVNA